MPSYAISIDPVYELYKKLWFETWLSKSSSVHIQHAQPHALMETHLF